MLFNSLHFLVFFTIVTTLYFLLPHRVRWFLLLISSCYFYMAFIPIYILILGFTIIIDYWAGVLIEQVRGRKRGILLFCSLAANIGVLAVFKYYNFLNDNLSFLLRGIGGSNPIPSLSIILPIGLSFFTFQAMSYLIEVYCGRQKAERHFGIYALFVMFYPQLVAGPIERPQNLLHQFHERHSFSSESFKTGLLQIAFGLFKKVVIADRLAMAVDYAYGNYTNLSGLSLLIASVFYSFQIYCDFSGYSDIAIGSARAMGFNLMSNFDAPYFSSSIGEFWKRWHISLSTWFRDYVYFPLGGNRRSAPRVHFNLMAVFILSGLWHGANWTFVIWGALHGFFLIIEKRLSLLCAKMPAAIGDGTIVRVLRTAATFAAITVAWIFFRAESLDKALAITGRLLRFSPSDRIDLKLSAAELLFSGLLILLLLVKESGMVRINIRSSRLFMPVMTLIALACYFFGVFNQRQFIYFQF
ncbi:MAG: MBOAT family protein [Chitinispirillaceae bacterium]|nr:MBOAT family protein [Chitinispirillaceae bacterium]